MSFRKVPAIEDRENLVRQAHCLGHFASEKTLNLLKTKYYWPHMYKDVDFVIDNCLACLKFKKFRPKDHPAMSLPILGINDRVSIDQVHGLPLTIRGFSGANFLTEHVTGYATGYPIKGKTQEETGKNLWEHITRFGPPKELLSDMGREYVNGVVKSLTRLVGADHVVTSAYRPNTNGLQERANSTLCESLRVFCSVDNGAEDWDIKLPYVVMSYNMSVNSSRKFSPHELMFASKMNFFEDYSLNTGKLQIPLILKRANEIRILHEETLPEAISNLLEAQVQHRKTQDKQHNVQIETLKVGSKVMLWDPKIKGKLAERKSGPYFISKLSSRNNYFLTNCRTHVALKNAIPLRRLEPVEDTVSEMDEISSTNYDISKIKSIRGQKEETEFLVEWKDKPRDRNTWVLEEELKKCPDQNNTEKLLENFKRSLLTRVNTRQTTRLNTNPLNSLSFLFLCLICFPFIITETITGNFKVCSYSKNSKILNYDEECNLPEKEIIFATKNITVLEKRLNMINGVAYSCWAEQIVLRSWRTLFIFPAEERLTQRIIINAEDCWKIVRTRSIFNEELKCNNESTCVYYREPLINAYPHLGSLFFIDYHIISTTVKVKSSSLERPIFEKAFTSCLPKDFFCIRGDTSYVWNNSIIHDCEFFKVKTLVMKGNSQIFFSNNTLLKVTKIFKTCNIEIMATSEGLFLSVDRLAQEFSSEIEDENLEHHLLISDFDKKLLDLYTFITKEQVSYNLKFCLSQKNHLHSIENLKNKFSVVRDNDGREIVIFNKDYDLLITECLNVSKIILNNKLNECFSQIPIYWHFGNTSIPGFLFDHKVIATEAEKMPCSKTVVVKLDDNIKLKYENGITKRIQNQRNQVKLHLIDQTKITLNFDHNKDVIFEINLNKDNLLEADADHLYFIPKEIGYSNSSVSFIDNISDTIREIKWNPFSWEFFKEMRQVLKILCIIIISLIICTSTGVLMYLLVKCYFCIYQLKQTKKGHTSELEMDNLGKIHENTKRKESADSTTDRRRSTNIVEHSTPLMRMLKENPILSNVEDDNEDGQSLFSKNDTQSFFDIKRFQDSISIA